MKKSFFSIIPLFIIIAFIAIVVISIVMGEDDVNNEGKDTNNSASQVKREYFDSYSYNRMLNSNSYTITIKYYKDDFKYENSCFKVYYDLFINDALVRAYRENSPYEVKVSSPIYTSNYCVYDNSDEDDITSVTNRISDYIKGNTYIIKGDQDYLAIMLPMLHVSSYDEEKVVFINSQGDNIYSFNILKPKEAIKSTSGCRNYNSALYSGGTRVYEASRQAFSYLQIDAHLNDGTLTLNENKITINNDEVNIELTGKCIGK